MGTWNHDFETGDFSQFTGYNTPEDTPTQKWRVVPEAKHTGYYGAHFYFHNDTGAASGYHKRAYRDVNAGNPTKLWYRTIYKLVQWGQGWEGGGNCFRSYILHGATWGWGDDARLYHSPQAGGGCQWRAGQKDDNGEFVLTPWSEVLADPRDDFVTVEWYVALETSDGAADGVMRIYVNGILASERTDFETYNRLYLVSARQWWWAYQIPNGKTEEVYFDDFYASTDGRRGYPLSYPLIHELDGDETEGAIITGETHAESGEAFRHAGAITGLSWTGQVDFADGDVEYAVDGGPWVSTGAISGNSHEFASPVMVGHSVDWRVRLGEGLSLGALTVSYAALKSRRERVNGLRVTV